MIESSAITKKYKKFPAVDSLTFDVGEGEVFGFLGPNGAGKTTTIKILTCQLKPTSGSARVAGFDVVKEREKVKSRIGVVFEDQNLYERLSAWQNLEFFAGLYGVDRSIASGLIDRAGLKERANDAVSKFSRGMKQKLLIARALLPSPKVLFLDEPTLGLDPHAARELRNVIRELSSTGVTIFLTTHYMEEADELCSRVAIIDKGKIVALDTPQNLKAANSPGLIDVDFNLDGKVVSRTIAIKGEESSREMAELISSGNLVSVKNKESTLEDVFIKLTGRSLE
ncbi:MAG: ATP-binding cassette domain-containing protein [Firmicutes bacterium]|nr:ATP-binding cassette domain-containing protein [Bacillota bacterium]